MGETETPALELRVRAFSSITHQTQPQPLRVIRNGVLVSFETRQLKVVIRDQERKRLEDGTSL